MHNSKDAIVKTKEFIELWKKFNQIYKEAMGKTTITEEEEDLFLETKSIVARKFQTLVDSLSIERSTTDRTYDVISQILSLRSISTLSEESLRKISNDWHQSYISLNRLLGHLEAEKNTAVEKDKISLKQVLAAIARFVLYAVIIVTFVMVILFFIHVLNMVK